MLTHNSGRAGWTVGVLGPSSGSNLTENIWKVRLKNRLLQVRCVEMNTKTQYRNVINAAQISNVINNATYET